MENNQIKTEYVLIPLDSIKVGSRSHVDLFVKAGEKFVLVVRAGDIVEAERMKRYSEKRHDSIYINIDAVSNFMNERFSDLKSVFSSQTESPAKIAKAFVRALELCYTDIYVFKCTDEKLSHLNQILENASNILENDSVIQSFVLSELRASDTAVAKKATLGLVFASMIANNSQKMPAAAFKNLLMGTFLRDIGLSQVSDESIESEYQKHPQLSVNILKEMASIPSACLDIILEHHEKYDGTGFPEGVRSVELYPPSRIVIFAEMVCEVMTALDKSSILPLDKFCMLIEQKFPELAGLPAYWEPLKAAFLSVEKKHNDINQAKAA